MIACDVCGVDAHGDPPQQLAEHLHVALGPVPFAELPDVYNVTIQNNLPGFDTLEVIGELLCLASISTQMNIRQHQQIDFPFTPGPLLFSGFHDSLTGDQVSSGIVGRNGKVLFLRIVELL